MRETKGDFKHSEGKSGSRRLGADVQNLLDTFFNNNNPFVHFSRSSPSLYVIALSAIGQSHSLPLSCILSHHRFSSPHLFNLYFYSAKNLFDIPCESALSKRKRQLFALRCKQAHPKQTHFVWNSSTRWRYVCSMLCYASRLRCVCVWCLNTIFTIPTLGEILRYALVIAFNIPLLMHWIHISLTKIVHSLIPCGRFGSNF